MLYGQSNAGPDLQIYVIINSEERWNFCNNGLFAPQLFLLYGVNFNIMRTESDIFSACWVNLVFP